MLPSVNVIGYYCRIWPGRCAKPQTPSRPEPGDRSTSYAGTLQNAFNNTSPDYLAEVQVQIPFATGRHARTSSAPSWRYRQAQLNVVQVKKNLRIEVRNAAYALEQGQARVEAARKARDLAQKTFDIKKQEQQLGAGSNFETTYCRA